MSSLNGNDRTIPLPVAQAETGGCGCSGSEPKRTVDARKGVSWWRSLGERDQDAQALAFAHREFPAAADTLEGDDRRTFIKIMGAGFALAGLGLAGCRRWPESQIVPNASQPANRTPGVPVTYATACELRGVGYGLIATSFDGRPIKLDGNPDHPFWGGGSTSWMQARVLELYDPERSRQVFRSGKVSNMAEFDAFLAERAKALGAKQGEGLAILMPATSSPSMRDMLSRVKQTFPKATVTAWEALAGTSSLQGTAIAFGSPMRVTPQVDKARIIVSLDWDMLGTEPLALRHTRDWAANRRLSAQDPAKQTQNRLYVFEPHLTVTGMSADNRVAVRRGDVPVLAAMLAKALGVGGDASLTAAIDRLTAAAAAKGMLGEHDQEIFGQMVKDLQASKGAAFVRCGTGQSAEVHALVAAINHALGANGTTLAMSAADESSLGIEELAKAMAAGKVDTLIVLGSNPCYDAPADLDFAKAMAKVPNVARLAYHRDETSMEAACTFHVPQAHFLECWGDVSSPDGTKSIQQPLIQPLIDPAQGGPSAIEVLARLLGGSEPRDGYTIVRRAFMASSGLSGSAFEAAWRGWLDKGVASVGTPQNPSASLRAGEVAKAVSALADAQPATRDAGIELCFIPDSRVLDGRFANIGWMQELPDPVTKITWDNALLVSPATATRLGVKQGSMVKVSAGDRGMQAAVFPVPGMADDSAAIALGGGRGESAGSLAKDAGFNAYPMRTTASMAMVRGASVQPTGETYEFAHTQDHGSIDAALIPSVPHQGVQDRLPSLVRGTSLENYKHHPDFAAHAAHVPHRLSLWQEGNLDGAQFRWAMSVDLTTCTGCQSCVTACQAENNIPIVGKDQVKRGREMFWIRVDRYFRGADPKKPDGFSVQPVTCMQCENAPCEQVCPVAATVHDADGLNNMVYNRCIGTRYCSNNCPYKVRRFNFFDYQRRDPIRDQKGPLQVQPDYFVETGPDEWLRMQFNPEVTVRMRGVMEKCTFCVQRIAQAKIKYKNEWVKAGGTASGKPNFSIPDGAIQTACQQACPAGAIVFGDLNDPNSQVAKLHGSKVSYGMLEELNVKPRLKYLARVSNPGVDHGAHDHGHDHGHGSDAGHGGHASATPRNGAQA
jgi:molybdopterin-containing oxidoreductase family iron-sulfur binding subunit